jgi:hypothetical protein
MYIFYITNEDFSREKHSSLRDIIQKLRRQKKYIINKSLYSLKREIFENFKDLSFIVYDESNNTEEIFYFDEYDLIYSNDKLVNIDDFLKKYNYPKEIYNKDIEDYQEELKYQVTQVDKPQQLTSVTVYVNDTSEDTCLTLKELITNLFDNIVDISDIVLYPRYSEILQIDFRDYKIKINYEDNEIIFTFHRSLFFLFDEDYNEMTIEDFLTKFYLDKTEKYTIQDFIRQRDDFINNLTEYINNKQKIYRGSEGVYGPKGYLDDLLQYHYQEFYGPDA